MRSAITNSHASPFSRRDGTDGPYINIIHLWLIGTENKIMRCAPLRHKHYVGRIRIMRPQEVGATHWWILVGPIATERSQSITGDSRGHHRSPIQATSPSLWPFLFLFLWTRWLATCNNLSKLVGSSPIRFSDLEYIKAWYLGPGPAQGSRLLCLWCANRPNWDACHNVFILDTK